MLLKFIIVIFILKLFIVPPSSLLKSKTLNIHSPSAGSVFSELKDSTGAIDPEIVVTPGIFVKRVVLVGAKS